MIQRLAIAVAGIAATIVLTVGLAAAGFGPQAAPDDRVSPDAELAGDLVIAAPPALEPEVVYVAPAPSPRTVVVRRPALSGGTSASRSSTPTRTIRDERDDDDRDDDGRDEREDREDHQEREYEDDDD